MKKINVNVPKNQKFKFVVIAVCIVIIVLSAISLFKVDNKVTNTVSIVKLNKNIERGQLITDKDVTEYKMYVKEYQGFSGTEKPTNASKIYAWGEKDKVVNTYSNYFQREGSVVYKDSITAEKIKKTPYMYSLKDNELLRLDVNQDYGKIIVPGDKLRVRAVYKQVSNSSNSNPLTRDFGIEKVYEQDLFDNIALVDLLNGKLESIVDIYYDLMSKSIVEREKMLKDANFKESITAKYYLVQVTPQQAKAYAEVVVNNPVFITTLLQRSQDTMDYVETLTKVLSGQSQTSDKTGGK